MSGFGLSSMRFGTVPNTGSNARDYCMLERNLLSHLRLALLLSVLSSSLLLRARLVPPTTPNSTNLPESSRIPLSAVEFGAAIASIIAGIWEYHTSCKDLRDMRAFLSATNPHLIIMVVVSVVVFATAIVLLLD